MDLEKTLENKKTKLKGKIKEKLGVDAECDLTNPKITAEQLQMYSEKFGFELVAIPGLNEVELNDEYFSKMYPKKNKFWKDEYMESIRNDHKELGGKFLLYESVQKPGFLNGIQLYGSEKGNQEGLDKLEKEFVEAYEFIEANDNLEEMLSSSKNRYSWSFNNINKYLIAQAQREFKKAGLPGTLKVRPATNFIDTIFFPYNGDTDTYEWTSTKLVNSNNNLTVGHQPLGGLSCVLDHELDTFYSNIGVRFVVEV